MFGVLDVFGYTPTEPHGLTNFDMPPPGVTAFGSLRFAPLRHPRGGNFKEAALFQFTETFLHSLFMSLPLVSKRFTAFTRKSASSLRAGFGMASVLSAWTAPSLSIYSGGSSESALLHVVLSSLLSPIRTSLFNCPLSEGQAIPKILCVKNRAD